MSRGRVLRVRSKRSWCLAVRTTGLLSWQVSPWTCFLCRLSRQHNHRFTVKLRYTFAFHKCTQKHYQECHAIIYSHILLYIFIYNFQLLSSLGILSKLETLTTDFSIKLFSFFFIIARNTTLFQPDLKCKKKSRIGLISKEYNLQTRKSFPFLIVPV